MTQPFVEEWIECRCGKVVHRRRYYKDEQGRALAEAELQLAAVTLCRSCGMDIQIETDSCPENVLTDGGGVSACRLQWHHQGRCEPFLTEEHYEEYARRRREPGT